MKQWNEAQVEELNISFTEQIPTTEIAFDDLQDGVFQRGTDNGSGNPILIPAKP